MSAYRGLLIENQHQSFKLNAEECLKYRDLGTILNTKNQLSMIIKITADNQKDPITIKYQTLPLYLSNSSPQQILWRSYLLLISFY